MLLCSLKGIRIGKHGVRPEFPLLGAAAQNQVPPRLNLPITQEAGERADRFTFRGGSGEGEVDVVAPVDAVTS